MKKTLAILLVLAFALALGVVAFAEGLAEEDALPAEETETVAEAEAADEAPADEAPAAEEAAEDAAEEAPAEEPAPAIPHPEDIDFDAWMARYNPSYDITEAEWRLCYVLNHRIQSWYCSEVDELPAEIAEAYGTTNEEELPWIIKYTSIGELDSTETIEVYYSGTDENGEPCEKTEIVTITIPAGETVFYVLDPGFKAQSGGFAIIAGSYGDRYEAPEA